MDPFQRRLRRAQALGVWCVALAFVLMVLGAWVKANGAGLACPDWPKCYGEWLPPFPSAENGGTWEGGKVAYTQAQVIYEWVHRAIQPLVIIPVVALAVVVNRGPGFRPALRRLTVAAIAIYVAQAGLGALTVVTGNPPWATVMHLALAVVWFATFVAAATLAYAAPALPPGGSRPFAPPGEARLG